MRILNVDAMGEEEYFYNGFNLVVLELKARCIKWELFISDGLPRILGDVNRLEQVFTNLILNARDPMLSEQVKSNGRFESGTKIVTIRSFVQNGRVVVTVSDTGPTIPESIVSKIFDPFFTTEKTGKGTVRGLYSSYGTIKDHQGTIEVDPVAGEGPTFNLTFPALPHGDGE